MPIDRRHYVPIVLTRMAERTAVRESAPAVRHALTPLFVAHPVAWDYEDDGPAKTLDEHLASLPQRLRQAWDESAFIDLALLDDDGPLAGGQHPLVWLTAQCAALGLPLVPVVSPTRTPGYRAATATVIARDHLGVCVRLQVPEWPVNAPGTLQPLLTELGVTPAEVDLLLDLGSESGVLALTALRQQLTQLPTVDHWRSLIVAGAGMPREMPAGQAIHVLPRTEWVRYLTLLGGQLPPRIPTFSDYAIAHPDPTLEVDPKMMSLSALLRYTSANNWLIAKGQLYKGPAGSGIGSAAMRPVAQSLQAHADYLGANHCATEAWLGSVAAGNANGGNPTTWRRYGTQHHLVVATNQLATLHGALVVP